MTDQADLVAMDLEALWNNALKHTEIIRSRALDLATFETTTVPYCFLAESSVNVGDTVVRKGQVLVERPALILPSPEFRGFDFETELQLTENTVVNFLLVRGVRFPSLRYRHASASLEVQEGPLRQAVSRITEDLKRAEDLKTGVVIGPEEAWQLSVLILMGSLVIRSAEGDLRKLLDEWRKRQAM